MSPPQPIFAPDQQPNFTHTALPAGTNTIRLLSLEPGEADAPLAAFLRQHVLSADLDFEALSYMWGPTEPRRSINVHGQVFQTRPNIHAFLRRLRDPVKPRVLWLDAICIDQNNTPERGEQVSMMRQIYTCCRRCLVWLGDDVPRGDEVLRVFAGNMVDAEGMSDMNNLIRLLYWNALAEPFRALLSIPYWSRVWMIQETTLPAKVVVHVGAEVCLLDHIPTQVRARMFELFQANRAQYQEWLRVFDDFEAPCHLLSISPQSQVSVQGCAWDDLFPDLVGKGLRRDEQKQTVLGFRKSSDRSRWEPVAVEVDTTDEEGAVHATFRSVISLSTVSSLSFPTHDFDPRAAFDSVECAFWCISNSRSEQLLDERRRYSGDATRAFSSVEFRNYLEHAERWHCTDVRDRVFGALGVFATWPRAYAFRADYSLSPEDLLLEVVDYCRPTDPFKLAIRLLLALNVDVESSILSARSSTLRSGITLMSRIAWPLHVFSARRLASPGIEQSCLTELRRSDVPGLAQTFRYFTVQDEPPLPTDVLASLGDGAVVIGVRAVAPSNGNDQWICVGVGFHAGFTAAHDEAEPAQNIALANCERYGTVAEEQARPPKLNRDLEGISLAAMIHDLRMVGVTQAGADEKGDDGVPVLWWIVCPRTWFLSLLGREQQLRRSSDATDSDSGVSDAADGSTGAIDGLPSSEGRAGPATLSSRMGSSGLASLP